MVLMGSLLCLAAVAVQAALLLSLPPTPLMFFLPGALVTMSQGIALPYAQAGAMATIPRLAGTAAGIGVFVQQVLGAGFAQLYGLIADGTPRPMIVATALSAVLGVAVGAFAFMLKRSTLAAKKIDYPIVVGTEDVAKAYGGVDSLPSTFIIDRDGKIAFSHTGLVGKDTYETEIRSLLEGDKVAVAAAR